MAMGLQDPLLTVVPVHSTSSFTEVRKNSTKPRKCNYAPIMKPYGSAAKKGNTSSLYVPIIASDIPGPLDLKM